MTRLIQPCAERTKGEKQKLMQTKLRVNNLSVSFNVREDVLRAVRGVSFELNEGETLAIVGESGSGKSVTSKAILGLLPKSAKIVSGEIFFGEDDLTKYGEREWTNVRGKKIAMVFQDPTACLNPILRVGEQIVEGILAGEKHTPKNRAAAKEKAIKLLQEVGIPDAENRFRQYPFEFSGGMKQRIVIAIALSQSPEILVCDEPTTALDVSVQAQILELINGLKKERNLSVVFITHDLGVVASMADRVAVMYAGKIVEYGKTEEIFYQPKHPYTWALLAASPDLTTKDRLYEIKGTSPDLTKEIKGDAFAPRNEYALKIDFEEEPPFFKVSETHFAATWLLDARAPIVHPPKAEKRSKRSRKNGE